VKYSIDRFNIIVGIVLAIVALAGIVGSYQLSIAQSSQLSTAPVTVSSSTVESPTVQFALTVQDAKTPLAFVYNSQENPTLYVHKGDVVKVALTNTGMEPHDFTLQGYNLKTKVLSSGQSDSIIFKADMTGTFTYYCSVPGHKDVGMQGQFVVE